MKKFLFFLMAATMLAGGAVAKHNCGCEGCEVCKVEHKLRHKQMEKGGFMDATAAAAAPVSVARILTLPDDTRVTVIGHITNRIDNGEYNFTDGSDNIVADTGFKACICFISLCDGMLCVLWSGHKGSFQYQLYRQPLHGCGICAFYRLCEPIFQRRFRALRETSHSGVFQ